MDIPALSMAMSQAHLQNDFGVAMLSKSLDLSDQLGTSITEMIDSSASMERSITPHIGGSIDISL